jgi:hypothetical protein
MATEISKFEGTGIRTHITSGIFDFSGHQLMTFGMCKTYTVSDLNSKKEWLADRI